MNRNYVLWLLLTCAASALGAEGGKPAEKAPEKAVASYLLPVAGQDLQILAQLWSGEQRLLKVGDVEFPAFVRAATGAKQGVLLMFPGDGEHPGNSPGINQIRRDLPAFGWECWIVSLEPPPSVATSQTTHPVAAKPGDKTTPPDTKAKPDPKAESTPPAATADTDATVQTTPAAAAKPTPDEEDQKRFQDWADRSGARIDAAFAAASAASKDPIAMIAEGSTAPVLLRFLGNADASPLLAGAVAIEARALPGLPLAWPHKFASPALETLTPGSRHIWGVERQQQARVAELDKYRQLEIDFSSVSSDEPSLLSRDLRGWLNHVESAEPATVETPGSD